MNICGVLMPDDLAALGSPYVAMHYAGNEARRHISTHRVQAVIESLKMDGGNALDVGCGSGFSSVLLSRKASSVVAVDLGAHMVRIAGHIAKLNRAAVAGVIADASKPMPFPDAHFDGLISIEMIEHIVDWRASIREMVRVLKPGGRLVISTPGRHGLSQMVKTTLVKARLWELGTYEWFIPRRQMIRELESLGVRMTAVKHAVFTAPMLPDVLMPLVRGIERAVEATGPLNRLCSTTIYCGQLTSGRSRGFPPKSER